MINDNIRRYRKEKGLSQEEMWENGKSVPDAKALIDAEAANKQGGDCE